MAFHARRLVEASLRIHALAPWDRVGEEETFAFRIPGHELPFAARLDRERDVTAFVLLEGGLQAWRQSFCGEDNTFGMEIGLLVARLGKIPPRYRGILDMAKWRCRRDALALSAVVRPAGRPSRNPRAREVRTALFAATAFRKAWESRELKPARFDGRDGVPLLKLSGAPHDPAIEWDRLVWVPDEEMVDVEILPPSTDAVWEFGTCRIPPHGGGAGAELLVIAIVDGLDGTLRDCAVVPEPVVRNAVETILLCAEPETPSVIRCGEQSDSDRSILAALRAALEPLGVRFEMARRAAKVQRILAESRRLLGAERGRGQAP